MRRQRPTGGNNATPNTRQAAGGPTAVQNIAGSFVQGGVMHQGQMVKDPPVAATPPAKQTPVKQMPVKKQEPIKGAATNVAPSAPMMGLNPTAQPPEQLMQTESQSDGGESDAKKPFRWMSSNKKPSVRAKERRIRQNRRLRKILIPKNALMALHEVKGIKLSDFIINSRQEGGFSAKLNVNNMQYEGIGNSKVSAKNSACEKALRDLVIFKMIQSINKPPPPPEKEIENGSRPSTEEMNNSTQDTDVEMNDVEALKTAEEDEVPMLNLASFALYKLFSEWENEGFEIPEFRPTNPNTSNNGATTPPPPTIKRELPAGWESMHPTSLLCMMRPGIAYSFLGGEGTPPNTTQRVGVSVDGGNFIGEGRSRKIARRNAAVDACNMLFQTNFVKE